MAMKTGFGRAKDLFVWQFDIESLLCNIIMFGFVNAYLSPSCKSTIFHSQIFELMLFGISPLIQRYKFRKKHPMLCNMRLVKTKMQKGQVVVPPLFKIQKL